MTNFRKYGPWVQRRLSSAATEPRRRRRDCAVATESCHSAATPQVWRERKNSWLSGDLCEDERRAQLVEFPEGLRALTGVRELTEHSTRRAEVPWVEELTRLVALDISGDAHACIDSEEHDWQINGCQLGALPDELFRWERSSSSR